LIRWSENGDSFIVVDEDEFAKTLIPELFKHNNYASFVRQLNMYGFHKKVGLSDNSMRASERKNKSPSEYYNPYFKRGRPNLLWLVQKPKNPQGKGGGKGAARIKQEDGNLDDDGEEIFDSDTPVPANHGPSENTQNLRNGRQQLMLGQAGNGLPREELANVQRELQAIRHQQQVISSLLQQTREQHKQLYGQAAAFQSLHDRHESSINAILTFLATVYNRSLEGQSGPNFANMFAGAIPHDNQGQGNVVDVGDYQDQQENSNGQPQRTFRRQPLLLKAPPVNYLNGQTSSPATNSVVDNSLVSSQPPSSTTQTQRYATAAPGQVAQSPAVQALSETQTPSNRSSQSPQVAPTSQDSDVNQIPEADILSMINSANASTAPFSNGKVQMNFPEVLSHLQTADGKSPLTANERHDVLQLMANGSAATTQNGNNNALTFPNPPEVPGLQHYNLTKEQIDFLGQSLKEQDQKVNELSYILAPLSPSGSIPGITDAQALNNEMLDLDQIFNSGDYFDDANRVNLDFAADDNGLNEFLFETSPGAAPSNGEPNHNFQDGASGANERGAGRIVETMSSSETTSPANTVDESVGGAEERGTPEKKRIRKG
jgi:heat shock transcription factor